jgi:hypothetical protein
MPQAEETHTMNRRVLLSTMVAVPAAAAVAAAPITAAAAAIDPRVAIDRFAELFLQVSIAEIAENDEHAVYAVRLPRDASPNHDGLVALAYDDRFGADLAAWIAERL